jgi:hypothetical protein
LPTPTPAPPAAGDAGAESTASTGAIELGLEERVYIDQVNNIVARYGTTATTVEDLLSRAAANDALLQDETWQGQVNTAIQVLRRTGAEIRNIDTPPLLAAAHIDLVSAAGSFDQAAALMAQGLSEGALAAISQGVAEFEVGRSLLTQAQAQLGDDGP